MEKIEPGQPAREKMGSPVSASQELRPAVPPKIPMTETKPSVESSLDLVYDQLLWYRKLIDGKLANVSGVERELYALIEKILSPLFVRYGELVEGSSAEEREDFISKCEMFGGATDSLVALYDENKGDEEVVRSHMKMFEQMYGERE